MQSLSDDALQSSITAVTARTVAKHLTISDARNGIDALKYQLLSVLIITYDEPV